MTASTLPAISEYIWNAKYRLKKFDGTPIDQTISDTWDRVATALAGAEKPEDRKEWADKFFDVMDQGLFSPAGRIISGAGSGRNVTLSNCLSGETLILTAEYGLVRISEIDGETVTVMDGLGNWVEAPINSFGIQPTAPVTLRGGYNGRDRKTIHATAGHRWILQNDDESTTEFLDIGNVLKTVKRQNVANTPEYAAGVRHGVIYGDGSQRPGGEIKLRLCGDKKRLLSFFISGWTLTVPPAADGDTCVYGPRDMGRTLRVKSLPEEGCDVAYLTGFLRGWLATDGCVTRGKALISCGAEEADWLRKFGPVAGMEVSCVTKLSDGSNFGRRNKTLFNVHFHRWTMIEEDFLMDHHKNGFRSADYPWVVESVGVMGEPEPVYCPRVVTTDSVQLDLGIHTGQCFTMGTLPDSMDGIFSHLKEAALTMQQGGGIGYDFSTIRPRGAEVKGVAADASGPLSFMDVWDAMCRTVMSAGSRRGAMMATMRVDHPDIEAFIEAKRDPLRLRMFNLSVLITDEFMRAVRDGHNWRLHFENRKGETLKEKIVDARELWTKIMRNTYEFAEPGVIFIDRVNEDHNLGYLEAIATTNPCGEKPMGPYASCLLGSINLAKLIMHPFTDAARIHHQVLREVVPLAIRMMDNVIDVGNFPLPEQKAKAQQDRQLGLGVTGLADALIMVGLTYGSPEAVEWTEKVMREIAIHAYSASVKLAKEKGAFPTFNCEEFLKPSRFAGRALPRYIQDEIRADGIRNGLLLSIAPTGTISMFGGNVSSGIEPVFAFEYERKILRDDGTHDKQIVQDFAAKAWREYRGEEPFPERFVTTQTLEPAAHIRMQAAAQKWIDSSISKTVNCPEDISFEDFEAIYQQAFDSGCKGCTTYRPNAITGSILSVVEEKPEPVAAEYRTSVHIRNESGQTVFHGDAIDFAAEEWPEGDGVSLDLTVPDGYPEHATKNLDREFPVISETPQPRPDELPGAVYKVKWPNSPHAIYVTVTDILDPATNKRRPFEVFINSKNMEHFAWTVALTRMISAIFRRPHDSRFVVSELKAVFDPQGGAYIGGKFVPSVLAAIGGVIEAHMQAIGYMEAPERSIAMPEAMAAPYGQPTPSMAAQSAPFGASQDVYAALAAATRPAGPFCASCSSFNVKFESGCFQCLDCGHSKCG